MSAVRDVILLLHDSIELVLPGPATSARFSSPYGLSSDGMGGYFIADTTAAIVRRIFSNGTIVTIAASYKRLWGHDDLAYRRYHCFKHAGNSHYGSQG